MLRSALAFLVSTLVVSLCSGCTLVGMTVGSAIPRKTTYGEESPAGPALARAAADERLEAGDHVVVIVSPATPPGAGAPIDDGGDIAPPPPRRPPSRVEGDYRSIKRGVLALDNEDYYAQVPLDRVEKARVSHGSYWLAGMFVGLGVDAVMATTITATLMSAYNQIR